jgi:phenylalanyl-tRNA synthetase beta chain
MKISYNWLKWYIPEIPQADKLADIFTYHVCEVESVQETGQSTNFDYVFDLNILPNRAHDLLSHQGVARELASLLNIPFVDPAPKYKTPQSKATDLKINVESEKCRRYMGRIIRNIKIGPSPEWVKMHLESIGERSINNMVDAANIVMFDCGQPTHVFDLNKIKGGLVIRQAKEGEQLTTLDNKEVKLKKEDLLITDKENPLVIAGIKGGKIAEVDGNTVDVILEVANFDATSIRKTGQRTNIFTNSRKRFENDLSPELDSYAMRELSALILEMCPEAQFEDIVDVYPKKQEERKLSFSANNISNILGVDISQDETENILKRYNFEYKNKRENFVVTVPPMRLDLQIEEDIAEEIGRIIGYDKVKPKIPKINFTPKVNEIHAKISWAREKLLNEGYSEVMTYVFQDKGEVEVLASASDKKFLRTNLTDGLKDSLKLNQVNLSLLSEREIKIFEIGTVFLKNREEIRVGYGDKKNIAELTLDKFVPESSEVFHTQNKERISGDSGKYKFQMWSLFPFIARDIAVWVPDGVSAQNVEKVIKDNAGELVIKGPELFDEFKKDGKISYAFKLVFQSYQCTLTDTEINEIMLKISDKINENNGWQVR